MKNYLNSGNKFGLELGPCFTKMYGDIIEAFYDSMISMYIKVMEACDQDEALFRKLNDRLYTALEVE